MPSLLNSFALTNSRDNSAAAELSLELVKAKELSKDGIDPEGDYEVDEKQRSCILTDQGFAKCEEYLGVNDLYNPQDPWAHYITNALKAFKALVI